MSTRPGPRRIGRGGDAALACRPYIVVDFLCLLAGDIIRVLYEWHADPPYILRTRARIRWAHTLLLLCSSCAAAAAAPP